VRRTLATCAILPTILVAAVVEPAGAQEPSPPPRLLQPFGSIAPPPAPGAPASPTLSLVGEPTGDTGALPGYFASAPLRLSLANTIFPIGAAFDQCGTRGDATGNSTGVGKRGITFGGVF
jgi:hypothetical protein